MGKVKVTEALIEKAKSVIGKGSIKTNEGLTRSELRALERKKIVEKLSIFGTRKYKDGTPTISYVWKLKR